MLSVLNEFWPHILALAAVILTVGLSVQVILEQRDEHATVTWVGLLWLSPFLGALIYLILGTDRIRRRAIRLRPAGPAVPALPDPQVAAAQREQIAQKVGPLDTLSRVVSELTHKGMTGGNHVALTLGNDIRELTTGDMAFENMLQAIDGAEKTVILSSYIFNLDGAGRLFTDALIRAKERGVKIRVLVDGIGGFYSWRSATRYLTQNGIPAKRFLHSFLPWRMPYLNLRNHQKILVVDGKLGFTGGMNIRKEYLSSQTEEPIRDLHFRIEGPVVRHLSKTFAREWYFTTEETLEDFWIPDIEPRGQVLARGIWSGPDEPIDKVRWTILGAIAAAQRKILVVTPYFLPDESIHTALRLAAMRGLEVHVVLPEENNLAYVKWASMGLMEDLITANCKISMTRPPFDHSKLMIVDDRWVLLGSANWDPRSLRLNFEFNMECYDEDLAARLDGLIQERLVGSRPMTLQELRGRSLPEKLRDGIVRLLKPYL